MVVGWEARLLEANHCGASSKGTKEELDPVVMQKIIPSHTGLLLCGSMDKILTLEGI
jgi:hypothetical protein